MAGSRAGLKGGGFLPRWLLLGAALAGAALPARAGLLDLLRGTNDEVRITRTGHGIAHIEASSEEGIAYGIGYAHAQDHFCATADLLVTLRGERSRWFGAETSGTLGMRSLPNRVIDFFVRAHMDDTQLAQAWRAASPEARAQARGVVAGFDRYLEEHHDHLPADCAGAPWVQPMTLAEFRRMGEAMMIEAGVGAWADAIVAAQPPRADGVPTKPAWLPIPPVDGPPGLARQERPDGSNAFAFGRDASLNGQGLLLANPHMPWNGPDRFWQVHLTIPGRLDVMGATLGTLPFVAIGFNPALAWSHTVSTGRRFTLHELHLVPGNPRAYVVDGLVEPMTQRTVHIAERGADGRLEAREQVFWSTRFGPVVVAPTLGLVWTPAIAYALQDVTAGNARWLDTWRAIDRAGDVVALRGALALQGVPWMATVAADRAGHVLYTDTSAVPDLDAGRILDCAPSREAVRLWERAGLRVLDGSRSGCDWARDPGSLVPGAIAPARMPALVGDDWVQSTSDGSWLANPAAPLVAGFPPLLGATGVPLALRSRAALRDITARLEGRDGRALHQRMGPEELARLLLTDTNFAAGIVLDDLLAICPQAPSEATRAGCAVLAQWDRRDDLHSRGAHVFREFWRRAQSLPELWRVPFDRKDPIHTPLGLNVVGHRASPTLRNAVFDALGQAVHAIRAAGFALDAPLGDLQRRTGPAGPVPLAGGEEFEGVLNVLATTDVMPLTRAGYAIDTGTSYLQIVAFEEDGPVAWTLLPYGQSSDPASPYAFDQLPAFSAKQWYIVPFKAADIAAERVAEVLTLRFRASGRDGGEPARPPGAAGEESGSRATGAGTDGAL
jgi:acyl-homoserine-lactone acylase